MSGLLGSMIAGGVKQVAQGQINQLDRQDQFNMQNALQQARVDMELRLREAGINMQEQSAARDRERIAGYSKGANGEALTVEQAAANARNAGDLDTAKGLLQSEIQNDFALTTDGDGLLRVNRRTGDYTVERERSPQKLSLEDQYAIETDPKKKQAIANDIQRLARAKHVSSDGNGQEKTTAEITTSKWLIANGLAKDASQAWDMVTRLKGKSLEDKRYEIAQKLQSSESNQRRYRRDPSLLQQDIDAALAAIDGSAPAVGSQPKSSAPAEQTPSPVQNDPIGLRDVLNNNKGYDPKAVFGL